MSNTKTATQKLTVGECRELNKVFSSIQKEVMTLEEKRNYLSLRAECSKAYDIAYSFSNQAEAIRSDVEQRTDDYTDENFEEFFTARKTTAKKLKAFLSEYGRVTIFFEEDSRYGYGIAKGLKTKELKEKFNTVFQTDIYNGYIDGFRVN